MSSKSRNPKKNPAARRRRGAGLSGLPLARFRMDDVGRLMLGASAEAVPLMGLSAVLLWNMAEDGAVAAACVDCCVTLRYALAEYGIASEIQAAGVGVAAAGAEPELYGPDGGLRPHYNADGTFNGHTILVIPAAGRLLDPTVQQFPEVPRTVRAAVPLIAPLPVLGGLGVAPFGVDRGDHAVMFVPLPVSYRDAWQATPVLAQRARGSTGKRARTSRLTCST